MKKKTFKKACAGILAAALAISMVPTGVLHAAVKPSFSQTSATIVVGETLTLKVKNKAVGTTCKWKTSKKSVAAVTQKGVVKGKKAGKAVITCDLTTKTKKKVHLKCRVTVTTNAEVKTQKQLEIALRNKKVRNITIRTSARKVYNIPAGDYSNKGLIVKTPNAEVNNYGVFRAVTIKAIKSDTWHEYAKGNTLKVTAAKAHIVVEAGAELQAVRILRTNSDVTLDVAGSVVGVSVEKKANVKLNVTGSVDVISVKSAGAVLAMNIDGYVNAVKIQRKADIVITGSAKSVPVTVSSVAADTSIAASVPVAVETSADMKIELQKGAEGSAVKIINNTVTVDIKNDTTEAVRVTVPSGERIVNAGTEQSVSGLSSTGNTGSTGQTGGSSVVVPGGSGSSTTPGESSNKHTVTFDSNGGSAVSEQIVEEGGLIRQPEDPIRSGYTFDGWYTSASDGQKFDFNTTITNDIILYAHWKIVDVENRTYRVTFDKNDGSDGVYQVQRHDAGAIVNKPADPTRELYRFTGWYMEPAAITEYDFNAPVVSDLTLYAGWGNPDGTDGDLYAASDKMDTIYSITGIDVADNDVTVTYNTNSKCLMTVEFFEDQMSESDWSKEAQASNLNAEPIAHASGYTVDYGEMVTVTLPVDGTISENFVVRAVMVGTGQDEDPDYVSFQYTAKYEEFEEQTVDSVIEEYGEDLVINFDDDRTTNFGVLKDSVKVITKDHFIGNFEVIDIETEDGEAEGNIVPEHEFIFKNADDEIRSLQKGDVVYLEGTTWMFKIGSISEKNGTVTLTKDKEAAMTDFYDVLQVEMEGSDADTNNMNSANEENGIAPMWEIIDVDASLSGEIDPLSFEHKFENGIELSGSVGGKVTGDVEMSYDAHLFSADYFECSVSFTTEIAGKIKAEMSTDNEHTWKNVVYQVDTRKIKLPTPVTGLEVYVKPTAKINWKLSGSVEFNWNSKQTSGFKYNSDTGRTDIKKNVNTVSLMAKGKAEAKIGPVIDIGIDLLGGALEAGVVAEAGAKFTAEAQTGADDILNNVDSKHACGLCISGKAEWYAKASAKLAYKITNSFKGQLDVAVILDVSNPIYFLPNVPGEFFVSVINSADSPFGGAIKFGGGSCTNKTYRTEIQVLDENEQQITGMQISVIRQGYNSGISGSSPYISYLYEGVYEASTNINGMDVSKTFAVSGNRQTVSLSASTADNVLEGIIVDANDHSRVIEGASVKISKGEVVVASAESDSAGKVSVVVPEGVLKVEISKDGYLPFSSMETIYDGESHSMGLIELVEGTGMGGFRGVIRDATNNSPLSGVTLKLYKGWNSTTEANTAIRTLTTNDNGEFRLNTVTLLGKIYGLPSGNYTLTSSKDGYSDNSYNIVIYPGTTDENPVINETMSPVMNEGYYRIILTWGSNPSDLDSHLVADVDGGSGIHVYYDDMSPSPDYANLDVDDTTSYGPETITITNFEGLNNIRYAVHDYSNRDESSSTAMSYSEAIVRVFKGSQLLRTFEVPVGYGGTEWDVFSLDSNGRISAINSMKYTDSPESVLSSGRRNLIINDPVPLKDYEIIERRE